MPTRNHHRASNRDGRAVSHSLPKAIRNIKATTKASKKQCRQLFRSTSVCVSNIQRNKHTIKSQVSEGYSMTNRQLNVTTASCT